MVYDSRYLPLIQKPFYKNACAHGQIMLQPFFMKGHQSFGDDLSEGFIEGDEVNLFEINGRYDESVINKALQLSKVTSASILPSHMLVVPSIHWHMPGLIESQGVALYLYKPFCKYFSMGANLAFMRLHSNLELTLAGRSKRSPDGTKLPNGDIQAVENANTEIVKALGLNSITYSAAGMGDIDAYMRVGTVADYIWKMRHIDLGFLIGGLFPTATKGDIDNPASFAWGGNGLWGIYGALDGQFELKEDLTVGLLLRVQKRFGRTLTLRMPAITEPINFGAIVAQERIHPGVTFIASPLIELGGMRDGFGLRAQYTYIQHMRDKFDATKNSAGVAPNLEEMRARSSWIMELVTVTALYDFGKDKREHHFEPILSLAWDIPVKLIGARRVAKTHAISLTLEMTL